jgi:hypothetical protein
LKRARTSSGTCLRDARTAAALRRLSKDELVELVLRGQQTVPADVCAPADLHLQSLQSETLNLLVMVGWLHCL